MVSSSVVAWCWLCSLHALCKHAARTIAWHGPLLARTSVDTKCLASSLVDADWAHPVGLFIQRDGGNAQNTRAASTSHRRCTHNVVGDSDRSNGSSNGSSYSSYCNSSLLWVGRCTCVGVEKPNSLTADQTVNAALVLALDTDTEGTFYFSVIFSFMVRSRRRGYTVALLPTLDARRRTARRGCATRAQPSVVADGLIRQQ